MIFGGFTTLIQTFAAASVPAKVAVATVAGVGVVAAGTPVVVAATDAPTVETTVEVEPEAPDLPVVVTTVPESTTTAAPSAPVATTVPATSTTTTEVVQPEIRLWCERVDGERVGHDGEPVVCEWTVEPAEGVASFLVFRDGARVEAVDAEGGEMRWIDRDPPAHRPTYQVKALDRSGERVAASAEVTVAAESPDDETDEKDGEDEKDDENDRDDDQDEKGRDDENDDEKEDDEKDDDEKEDDEKDERPWEYLALWCDRAPHEGDNAVVCEFSLSDRDDFGHYVVKRDGVPIWRYDAQSMPGRPWPDIRFVDHDVPAGGATYSAYVVDSSGEWVGGSSRVTIGAISMPTTVPSTTPPTTGPATTAPPTTVPPSTTPPTTAPPTTAPPTTEPAWESMSINCSRQADTTVVCSFSQAQTEDFALYILKRNGSGILEWNVRSDTSMVDTEAPTEATTYAVYIMNNDGEWVGGSGSVTVPAV